ncbi:ATP synthase protein I [Allocatelliglobosispora scoriae]|uniref:ATP synthase protein I n=1 Tax=Allocatelliglobosispora scoriae TaxID=643052 RepID=A0A841BWI5_9ACTN|nr:ATP synthase protein I [Allocatelliglobosispora scoriae]
MLRKRLAHLPTALAASGIMLVLAGIVGAIAAGMTGALGAAFGVVLTTATYVASSFIIAWVDDRRRDLLLVAGLTTYVLKLIVLVAILITFAGWSGIVPMALGIVAEVFAWTCSQAWWTWHAKILYVDDPVDGPPVGGRPSS